MSPRSKLASARSGFVPTYVRILHGCVKRARFRFSFPFRQTQKRKRAPVSVLQKPKSGHEKTETKTRPFSKRRLDFRTKTVKMRTKTVKTGTTAVLKRLRNGHSVRQNGASKKEGKRARERKRSKQSSFRTRFKTAGWARSV